MRLRVDSRGGFRPLGPVGRHALGGGLARVGVRRVRHVEVGLIEASRKTHNSSADFLRTSVERALSRGCLRACSPIPLARGGMSSALAPVAAAPRCASRGTARPRDSAAACVSARRADASARPLRARSSPSRARVSWTCAPRAPGRRGSAVPARAGPRFRDETERQRAIDRLSPKLPGTPGAGDAGDGPPPEISRPRDVTRPRRFKDAVRDRVDADVRRKARSDPRAARNEDPGPDPRELARRRRAERAEAESADRLEYLVSVIRAELGRPQSLLSVDGKTRDARFANCFHRLRNFGAVEIAFGLVKYCLLYTSPSPRDLSTSRMPSSA